MIQEYNCKEATYAANPLEEFVAKCAPLAWFQFFRSLDKTVWDELSKVLSHSGIEPPMPLTFEALNRVAPHEITVVIIGQDPTPQPGKVTGLAFSVENARTVPSSLNILLEVALEGWNVNINNGDLSSWASQGVLLLNSALTVNQGRAGSHIKHWATFSELLVRFISDNENVPPVVLLLWGNHAKYFAKFINKKKYYIISGGHPLTLGGMGVNNFFGGGYFLCANEFLGAERALRCGIAEKRRTFICISLNNKRITKQHICYMPRSFKL